MTQTEQIVLIAGMALVTFLIRYPILALVGRITLSARVVEALRYVPMVVLTAIIVPDVLLGPGGTVVLWSARTLASLVTIVVMWRSKNLLLTIVIGMAAFLLLKAVLV